MGRFRQRRGRSRAFALAVAGVAAASLAVAAPASVAAPTAVAAPAAVRQAAPEVPQLSQEFSPEVAPIYGTTTLTFTVTNTKDEAGETGWSFDDAFARGLSVAVDPGTTTTCTNGVVTAPAGATSIHVSGDIRPGQRSCAVSVKLTASKIGVYGNFDQNFTDVVGLQKPRAAQAIFVGVVVSEAGPATVSTGANFTYEITVTNITSRTLDGVIALDGLPPNVTFVSSTPAPSQTAPPDPSTNSGEKLGWDLGSLAAGQHGTVELTVTAPSSPQTVQNRGMADFNAGCTPKPDCAPQVVSSRPVVTQVVASTGVPWTEPGALCGLALVLAGYLFFRRRRRVPRSAS